MSGPGRAVLRVLGVTGPVALTAAWAVLGARTPGYSAVDDSISAIGALGMPQARGLQVALVWQAVGQACTAALTVGRTRRRTTAALAVAAAGTAAVALLPLSGGDGPEGLDTAHSVAATVAFGALHLAVLAAARDPGVPRRLRRVAGVALGLALPATAWFTVGLFHPLPADGGAEKWMTTLLLVVPATMAATDRWGRRPRPPSDAT